MKISKAVFTVTGVKSFRAQKLEGEAEGKLGKEILLKGTLSHAKIKGLFTDDASYQAILGSLYNEEGLKVTQDLGQFKLNVEGHLCKVTLLYALTDTHDIEEVTFDRIAIAPNDGKVAEVRARLRFHPEKPAMLAKIDQWLKNEVTVTLNGMTVPVNASDDEEEQEELDLPVKEDEELPAAGPGEVLPGVKAIGKDDPDVKANKASVESLQAAGVLAKGNGAAKPSTAHGEVMVAGQKPPQRPRRRPPGETIQ